MQTFPTEQNIRTLVDEQLKNLGWNLSTGKNCNVFQEQPRTQEEKQKLKGKRPDYVLYSSKEKDRREPIIIIETKKPGKNLDEALKQGDLYAEQLNAPMVFATDGIFYKTLHTKYHKPLYLNGEEIDELIRELEALKFLKEDNYEINTISKDVQFSRQELIKIFEESNNLLRDEGLRAGIERFGEFANILFLKLIGEIEDIKEEEKNDNGIFLERYLRWSKWHNKKGDELLSFVNDTVLPKIGEAYKDENIFTPLSIRNPKVLEKIIKKLEPLKLINIESDIKGDSFEYFLKQSTSTKNDLGEYFTPRHIVKTMVKLANPKFGEKIYDPFCGTGGMLIESFKHIYNNMPRNERNLKFLRNKSIFGNEITSTARITKMNMILIGDGHSGVCQKNSLENPVDGNIEGNGYDVVITNMPYSQKTVYGSFYDLPSSNGDSICVQHCIKAIDKTSENGRMAIIVPEGFLFRKDLQKSREYLLDRCFLKSIISLPQGVFLPYTGVKSNILYCTDIKKKKKQEKYWYFEVKNDGYTLDNHRKKIDSESDLQKFLAYRNIDFQEKKDVFKIGFMEIKIDDIKKNNFVLSGNRYKKEFDYTNINWEIVTIGKIAKVIRGVIYNKKDESINQTRNKVLRANNIISETNQLYLNDIRFLKDNFETEEDKKLIENDILVCTSSGSKNHLGKFAFINENKGYIAGGFMSIIRANKDLILPKYLYFILTSDNYREYIENITSGSNINNLKNQDIENFKFPLPPIEIQQKYVDELNIYEEMIMYANEIISSYKPHIHIGNDWKFIELGNKEFFTICSGGTPSSENQKYWNGNINWITLVDLPSGNFITEIYNSERKISKEGLESSSARLLPVGSILVSSRATIGRIGIARVELATNQGFKNIIIKKKEFFNEKFIAFMLTTLIDKMESMASGGTFKEISKESFEKLKIPFPSKIIQDKFVEEIEEEQKLIIPNIKIINFFKNKLRDRLNFIWGRKV